MNYELFLKIVVAAFAVISGVLVLIGNLTDDGKNGSKTRGWIAFALTVGTALAGVMLFFVDEYSSSTRESISARNHAQELDAVAKAQLESRKSSSAADSKLDQIQRSLTASPSPSPSVSATPKA